MIIIKLCNKILNDLSRSWRYRLSVGIWELVIKIYVERGIVPRRCSRKGAMKKKRKRKEKGDDEIEIERPPPSFYREAARESAIYVERRYVKQRGKRESVNDVVRLTCTIRECSCRSRVCTGFCRIRRCRPRNSAP